MIGLLRTRWHLLVVVGVIAVAVVLRIKAYGDPRLSIANNDTISYIESSDVNLLSWEAFISRRLFTTNLIYQALKPEGGYEIIVNGSEDTSKRLIQPTFIRIAVLQVGLSVICWAVTALVVASKLKNHLTKILAALCITVFAFAPHIADWDSLLTSESLTFSLFALQLLLLIILAFRLAEDPRPDAASTLLMIAWLVVVFLWTFLRDTNLYGLLIDIAAIGALLILPAFRRQWILTVVVTVLVGFSLLGWDTLGKSPRPVASMRNVYPVVILPFPARLEFMQSQGMPDPASPNYEAWLVQNGKSAYLKFLLHHPGYVLTIFFRDTLKAFVEGVQPYFTAPDQRIRLALVPVGSILHPEHPFPFFFDMLLLAGIWMMTIRKQTVESRAWVWLATWMYLFAAMILFAAIFGDTYALTRHALLATTVFRLFMWLFTIVLIDLALLADKTPETASTR